MIIRKITKAGRKRSDGTSWKERARYVVDYVDANGKRHQPVFATEKLAKAHQARVIIEMAGGVHVADSDSMTVEEAWDNFRGARERGGYSRSSIENHRIYYEGHVKPFPGAVKLTAIKARYAKVAALQRTPATVSGAVAASPAVHGRRIQQTRADNCGIR